MTLGEELQRRLKADGEIIEQQASQIKSLTALVAAKDEALRALVDLLDKPWLHIPAKIQAVAQAALDLTEKPGDLPAQD